MSVRWTEEDLQRLRGKLKSQISHAAAQTKYRNRRVRFQGMIFDSAHECNTWQGFKIQELAGEIRAVVRQVSMPLQGSSRRMRVDFMIVENDGRIRWVDAKGYPTPAWECKRDQIQQAYGLIIETV